MNKKKKKKSTVRAPITGDRNAERRSRGGAKAAEEAEERGMAVRRSPILGEREILP